MKFDEIKAGELGNKGNNSDVLKKVYWIVPKEESLDNMITGLDTKIKGDFFK